MEDFEKVKKEEIESQNHAYEEAENEKKNTKNKKALKISIVAVSAVALIGTGVFIGSRFLGNSTTINNNGAQNSNMATNNIIGEIDETKLQDIIKNELIKLAQKDFSSNKTSNNVYAEGHTILKSEVNDSNKIYSYVLAEYGVYSVNNTTKPESEGGSSMPLTFVIKVSESGEYNILEIKEPEDGVGYYDSLKEMFPEDLLKATENLNNGTYRDEFDKQILEYIKANRTESNEKRNITKEEALKLTEFFNKEENNSFVLFNYDNPKELFNHINASGDSAENILRYSLVASSYSSESNSEQDKIIWKHSNGVPQIGTYVVSEENLINFFKEKLNYEYSKEELREIYKHDYYKDLNMYAFMISDTSYTEVSVKDGYKENGKYYLTLTKSSEDIDGKKREIDVVVEEKSGVYYFYSCDLNNIESLSKEENIELTNFLNNPENNSFVLLNYTSSIDLLENIDNQPHKGVLKYSIIQSSYCSEATATQKNIIYKDSEQWGDTYVITEDRLIEYFKEKVNCLYSKESIKEAFKNDYNTDLNMYVFTISDTSFTNTSIKDAYKIYNTYYLALNHGQKVVLFKNMYSNIFQFESCTGYDGTIGTLD